MRSATAGLRLVSADDVRRRAVAVDPRELVWVDLNQPTEEDVGWLERTFHFHPLALEDVRLRHQRAKLDEYPDYYFGVLYAVRSDPGQRRVRTSELQFFWGATYLVTLHTEPFPEIDHLVQRVGSDNLPPVVGEDRREVSIADLAYRLIDAVVDTYFPAVDAVAEWSEAIESGMFASSRRPPRGTLQAIFNLKKDLLGLRKVISPSREAVNVLLRREQHLFGDDLQPYFQDVYDHTVRAIDSLDTYRDLLSSALDTYLSIVSNDVSQTVKKMTAVTAILMVDALVAGIYGMNFDRIPELHWEYGYAWALGLMLVLSLVLWALFRRIEWW
jgi:magnesium transporter